MPVRKSTIMSELMMENQWMSSSSPDMRKMSQRCDHGTSLRSQMTSYVYTTVPTSAAASISCGSSSRVTNRDAEHVSRLPAHDADSALVFLCLTERGGAGRGGGGGGSRRRPATRAHSPGRRAPAAARARSHAPV